MNAREIQYRLFRSLASTCRLVLPNYTPKGWFECDLFAVTRAGYFAEYEIKLTRADFYADRDKATVRRGVALRKHACLGDPAGPSSFWYVVPKRLADVLDVPEWAGLMWAEPWHHAERQGVSLGKIRRAPRLHRAKVAPAVEDHARGVCYWRLWQERHRVEALRRLNETLADRVAAQSELLSRAAERSAGSAAT